MNRKLAPPFLMEYLDEKLPKEITDIILSYAIKKYNVDFQIYWAGNVRVYIRGNLRWAVRKKYVEVTRMVNGFWTPYYTTSNMNLFQLWRREI
nr:hypothetical protein K-LCC10_0504 [Kaumoebavirus]